ncbi:UNVERIFIED_CONTAM: Fibroblast growth factor receptor 3 [Gekko kuhli]
MCFYSVAFIREGYGIPRGLPFSPVAKPGLPAKSSLEPPLPLSVVKPVNRTPVPHARESAEEQSLPSLLDDLRSEPDFLEELVFGSGDTIELPCDSPGPSVSVFWYKDGIGISPSNRTHVGQKLLRIINVSYDDAGLYSCRTRHSLEMLRNFTVRVTGKSDDDNVYSLSLVFSMLS